MSDPTPKITIEQSKGRARAVLRGEPIALPASAPEPARDERGRVLPGNKLARRKGLKKRADANGLTTVNPDACPPWLEPHARIGARYAVALADRFDAHNDPLTLALIGHAANAKTAADAFYSLGAAGDQDAWKLSLKWAQEHRLLAVTLSALYVQGEAERERERRDAECLASITELQRTPPPPPCEVPSMPVTVLEPEPLPELPTWTEEDD